VYGMSATLLLTDTAGEATPEFLNITVLRAAFPFFFVCAAIAFLYCLRSICCMCGTLIPLSMFAHCSQMASSIKRVPVRVVNQHNVDAGFVLAAMADIGVDVGEYQCG